MTKRDLTCRMYTIYSVAAINQPGHSKCVLREPWHKVASSSKAKRVVTSISSWKMLEKKG